ncbi:hypothetical protein KQI61_07960 [Anaerocolumna aminovalerica]|uniref:hypothetical protein n=1 Tax=Anaerocolumna aminovalerica TaxID=1527 RepID=UPI001C0EBDA2|nr:hypothetical protein [Anaerocolumna aminovalerica]MBU5332131.1 hypothetical protein [Anaerocolumna aminovalerica]
MEYTEIRYVDAIYGNDESGDGSENNPYQTIQFCKSKLTTSNPLVYIKDGNYRLRALLELRPSVKQNITYIGNSINTILNVVNKSDGDHFLEYPFTLIDCIITPSEDSIMTEMLYKSEYYNHYLNDTYYNVVFLKRGAHPTYFVNEKYVGTGIKLNNCILIGGKVSSGSFNNCATTENNSKMLSNCLFNEDYLISDETGIGTDSNNTYGVYSGEYAWTAFLLRQNGNYYSIYDSLYNSEKSEYEPLTKPDFKYKFSASRLFDEIIINKEKFKPIDKFDNFSLILPVLRANSVAKLNGIKSNKELIVQTFDVNVTLIKNINNLNLNVSNVKSSFVKLVCSKDMGESWFTIIDDEIVITDCIIPKKRYEDFTNDDLMHFNSAKETICEIGFIPDVLSSFDFNSSNIERLRFAYVLSTDDYDSNPNIEGLTINFDEKGYLKEMKDAECDIEVFEHMVRVTSKINSPRIETSIII